MICRQFRPVPIRPDSPRSASAHPVGEDDLVPALESTPRGPRLTKKRPRRTELGAMGEYYRAIMVMEERVTKWPAPRDDVEYDVLRVSVNGHTN